MDNPKEKIERAFLKAQHEIKAKVEKEKEEIELQISHIDKELGALSEIHMFSKNAVEQIDSLPVCECSTRCPDAVVIGNLISDVHKKSVGMALLPFTEVNASTFLVRNMDEVSGNILQLIAIRLMLSLHADLYSLKFIDLNSYGSSFREINGIKSLQKTFIDREEEITDCLKDIEDQIRERNRLYLSDYKDIRQYNASTKGESVPYVFVFISHFPYGFQTKHKEKLINLIKSRNAANAGVYFFISCQDNDMEKEDSAVEELKRASLVISQQGDLFKYINSPFCEKFEKAFSLSLDVWLPENISVITKTIEENLSNVSQNIVSFDSRMQALINGGQYWQESSIRGIKIPIGEKPDPYDRTVYFELGGKTKDYFAMIGGRPGYGKTVLLHNIICNGAILYSPEELQFYLIDCTNGTGFKPYDNLPHATFVSITKQREYTHSALAQLIVEMYNRADLYKIASENYSQSVDKLEVYREVTGSKLSRILVIIDEFQVLLEKRDQLTRQIRQDLEKLFREGRKYGISLVLCTQSYNNVDIDTSLISLRIAFNLTNRDSYQVLGNDKAATLNNVGEAILNNCNGRDDDNVRYKCAYIQKIVEYVRFCNEEVARKGLVLPERFVFDGNFNKNLACNKSFVAMLLNENKGEKIYLGVPAFLRREDHMYIKLQNSPKSNLLIMGDDRLNASRTMALVMFQFNLIHNQDVDFYVFDFSSSEQESFFQRLDKGNLNMHFFPSKKTEEGLNKVEEILDVRLQEESAIQRQMVLILYSIQQSQVLKKGGIGESKAARILRKIISRGPECGIRVFMYSYTLSGITDIYSAPATDILQQFRNRILLTGGERFFNTDEHREVATGHGLLYSQKEESTYYPAPFVFYSSFDAQGGIEYDYSHVLKEIYKDTDL